MEETRALTFIRLRSAMEADALRQELNPDHLLLGFLKIAELTADDITPGSSRKAQTDADIAQTVSMLKAAGITDPKRSRSQLRSLLVREKAADDANSLMDKLFAKAATLATENVVTAANVLQAMLDEPSPVLRAFLPLFKQEADKKAATARNAPPNPNDNPLTFLPELTARIRRMRYTLLERVFGQDHVVHAFAEGMFNAEVLAAADEARKRPRAIFVFAGPPGVGKTFLAEQAAEALAIPFKRFDMSNYADHQSHINLIGINPAYKDAKPGKLTDFVREHPYSILLFDEIEKAHLHTVHLFLQLLDAGRLHDDFTDKDVSFRDTIVIFTTNAGRQLYEGDVRFNAAGYKRQTILNALETDVNRQTGQPFFPSAICSRIATGYPMLFNHLTAHDLETVCRAELNRCGELFAKQYNIAVQTDELLASVLLFAAGVQTDARTLRANAELFFKTELFKLFRLWENGLEDALARMRVIRFTVELDNLTSEVQTLFRNSERQSILLFGSPQTADKLRAALPNADIYQSNELAEALKILSEKDVHLVLGELKNETPADALHNTVRDFNFVPATASSLKQSRAFFRTVRERLPEMPYYLLETSAFAIDDELLTTFARAGARGKLTLPDANPEIFAEEMTRICNHAYLQTVALGLSLQRQVLAFETAPTLSPDKSQVNIRLREFTLHRAVEADDAREVLADMERPETRFTDVIGATDAKTELQYFVDYLRKPKRVAASGYKPPKGVLLYGPPGTGKTLLARAMAGESDVAFIPASASSFVTKWQGSGPESVRTLFARARRYAPSIIFIDEIDAIGRTRGSSNSGHGEEMALNALLTEMDGFTVDPKRPVFVLAATNYGVEEGSKNGAAGTIDPALLRRFDRKIVIDLPNKDERAQYLSLMLGKRPNAVSEAMIQTLAGRSTGYSPANLETFLELAFRMAARKAQMLDDELIEEAFELNRHGEKKDWGVEYLERVARHEAGHAYMYYADGRTPAYLTIVARGEHGGYMEHSDVESGAPLKTRDELLARIRTALGGRAAELVYYGDTDGLSSGAANDLQSATRTARTMLCSYGMDETLGAASLSDEEATRGPLAEKINARINALLSAQLNIAVETIRNAKPAIDRLTAALLEKNKLNADEIEKLLKEQTR